MVIDPLPKSLQLVKVIDYSIPTFGDGYCYIACNISPQDRELILASKPWKTGLLDMGRDPQKTFSSIWPSYSTELELYHYGTEYPWVDMIISKDHTKIIFLIHK